MNAQDGSVVTPTGNVAQQGENVKPKSSREMETVEELKKQNELLKKQVDYWHSQTAERRHILNRPPMGMSMQGACIHFLRLGLMAAEQCTQ